MSDNPTDAKSAHWMMFQYEDDGVLRFQDPESGVRGWMWRADVLAALPDKEWWCFDYEALGRDICSPEDTHSDTGRCHWAVKP